MPSTKRTPHLLLSLLVLLGACSSPTPPAQPVQAEQLSAELALPQPLRAELFARIAVLGASGSAGFGLEIETGTPARLADFLDQALLVPHELVADGATELFFLDPEGYGSRTVVEALGSRPSLVVAPDFLFWFFYGRGPTAEARRARLEIGLTLLSAFECPLVVGDIPDMREAAGGMIPFASMPPADSFAGANARIRAWAAERENVTVVPLVAMNEALASGQAYTIGDLVWDPSVLGDLLQADHLHPNLAGTALMTLEILEHLAADHDATLVGVARSNPEELVDAVDDLVSAR